MNDDSSNVIYEYTEKQAEDDGFLLSTAGMPEGLVVNGRPVTYLTRELVTEVGVEMVAIAKELPLTALFEVLGRGGYGRVIVAAVNDLLIHVCGVAELTPDNPDGYMLTSVWAGADSTPHRVWFVKNGTGDYTGMRPADY